MPSKALVLTGVDFSTNKLKTVTFGTSVPCTGISLDVSTKSVTSMSAFTLTATPAPSNTTDEVTWTTSDSSVATVVSGVVTPLKLGTVTITATCGEYSANCAVTIDNVVVPYKAVAGYVPFKRSASHAALTTGKNGSGSGYNLIIASDQASGLYPIESKSDVDTSPYRFVPIMIPAGATKVIFSTSLGKIKTRSMWIDSTRSSKDSTYTNDAACCVQGGTSTDYDQGSTAFTPVTVDIPQNVSGLDSVCFDMVIGSWTGTANQDYTEDISIVFSYGS